MKPMVDWYKVENIVLRSFTGSNLTQEETDYIREAFKIDPEEYKKRSEIIRSEERKRMSSL